MPCRKTLAEIAAIVVAGLGLLDSSNAAPQAENKSIQVFISPKCKDMFYGPDFVDIDVHGKPKKTEKRLKPDYVPWDSARAKPMAYKDPRSSITFYVESDGRHLVAIGPAGNLLWVRNPWEDVPGACPYRTPRPVLSHIESIELNETFADNLKRRGAHTDHAFLSIQFDSSQFGVVDESNGDYFPEGQN
jgi:hypothetical protein